jgi:hypothetical protein
VRAGLDALEASVLAEFDPHKHRSPSERNAAALAEMARRSSTSHTDDSTDPATGPAPRGGRPRRRQLIAVIDIDPRSEQLPAFGTLDDGTILPRSTIARWLCDCALSRVLLQGRSRVLDVGQITYTPTAGQRRALVARERGDRWWARTTCGGRTGPV